MVSGVLVCTTIHDGIPVLGCVYTAYCVSDGSSGTAYAQHLIWVYPSYCTYAFCVAAHINAMAERACQDWDIHVPLVPTVFASALLAYHTSSHNGCLATYHSILLSLQQAAVTALRGMNNQLYGSCNTIGAVQAILNSVACSEDVRRICR